MTVYIQTILFDIFQVDSAADYLFQSSAVRGSIQYPAPFGRDATPEEAKIAELDAKTGASLKVWMSSCVLPNNLQNYVYY